MKTFRLNIQRPSLPLPLRGFTVPDDGARYVQIKHDFETGQWDFKPRAMVKNYKIDPPDNSLPDTVVMSQTFYPLSRDWQMFLFELMRRACFDSLDPSRLLHCWRWTTRDGAAQFDGHSWSDNDADHLHADYIQGLNLGSRYGPLAQQDLHFGGNIARTLGDDGRGNYIIETLDLAKPPLPADTIFGQWHLVGWLTNSTVTELGAQYKCTGWWGEKFLDDFGVPFLVIGRDGKNLLPKTWAKPIAPGAEYSPYILP